MRAFVSSLLTFLVQQVACQFIDFSKEDEEHIVHSPYLSKKKHFGDHSGTAGDSDEIPFWLTATIVGACSVSILLVISFCVYLVIRLKRGSDKDRLLKIRRGLYQNPEDHEPISLDMIQI